MAFVYYNPNPQNKLVGDCVIRAVGKLTNKEWEDAYMAIVLQGFKMHDMPSANHVWGQYLLEHDYSRNMIPNTCPECYTIKDFCEDHPDGKYMLATGTHVVAVENGDYYDTWDSGNEIPIYYFKKEADTNGVQLLPDLH